MILSRLKGGGGTAQCPYQRLSHTVYILLLEEDFKQLAIMSTVGSIVKRSWGVREEDWLGGHSECCGHVKAKDHITRTRVKAGHMCWLPVCPSTRDAETEG